jgi:hypothetical protein
MREQSEKPACSERLQLLGFLSSLVLGQWKAEIEPRPGRQFSLDLLGDRSRAVARDGLA